MLGQYHGTGLSLSLVCLFSGAAAQAEETLDLALVLAVDVSSSMTANEQELQRSGFIEAFQSTAVHKAIAKGFLGRIAVVYVEWGGVDDQLVLVPWTVIDGPEAGWSFAAKLSRKPMRQAGMTSISGAITFSRKLFANLKEEPARRVIDISGDGPNNDGAKVTSARDHAVAAGITLNALPITIRGPGSAWDIADLYEYYTDCVIGGPGSFMIPLHHADQFPSVIQAKILREIAGDNTSSLIHSTSTGADCLSGEKRRIEEEALGGEGGP
jgi:hypothetical protein